MLARRAALPLQEYTEKVAVMLTTASVEAYQMLKASMPPRVCLTAEPGVGRGSGKAKAVCNQGPDVDWCNLVLCLSRLAGHRADDTPGQRSVRQPLYAEVAAYSRHPHRECLQPQPQGSLQHAREHPSPSLQAPSSDRHASQLATL